MFRVELRRAMRDPSFIGGNLIMPVALCLLLGSHLTTPVPRGVTAMGYFAVSMAVFSSVSAALNSTGLRILKERHHGWLAQLSMTQLTPRGYLLLKLAIGAISSLIPVVVIIGLITLAIGAPVQPGTLVAACGVIWLGMSIFTALGTLLGYLCAEGIGSLLCVVIHVLLCLVGGIFWQVSSFPDWLRAVADVLPVYQLTATAHAVQAGDAPGVGHVAVLVGWLLAVGTGLALAVRRATPVQSSSTGGTR